MASTWPTESRPLLADLVAIPSVSGERGGHRAFVRGRRCAAGGSTCVRDDTGVTVEVRGRGSRADARARVAPRRGAAGRGLDPRSPFDAGHRGRPPLRPRVRRRQGLGGRDAVRGRGDVADGGRPAPRAAARDPRVRGGDQAHLDAATRSSAPGRSTPPRGRADQPRARRGAARADDGRPRGARRPAARGLRRRRASFTNAAIVLARDLLQARRALPGPRRTRCSAASPSRPPCSRPASAGTSRRPTATRGARHPQHARLDPRRDRASCCARALDSEVVVTSTRLVPCETPAGSRLLEAARARRGPTRAPTAVRPAPTGSSSVDSRRDQGRARAPAAARTRPDECVDLPRGDGGAGVLRAGRAGVPRMKRRT